MSMSKKDFIALADYLSDTEQYCEPFSEKQAQAENRGIEACNLL